MNEVDKLVEVLRHGQIIEYDLQPILDSPGELFRIEQEKYLLINKLLLKSLYFKWRAEFLADRQHSTLDSNSLDRLSRLILIVNPNLLTAWSCRKQLLIDSSKNQSTSIDFKGELDFCKLVLMKHFKCEQAYVHRRWLLRVYSSMVEQNLVLSELELIVSCLSRKIKSNYYCWTYFNWLLQLLDGATLLNYYSVSQFEQVLFTNPSDFCVFNSRLQLVKTILLDKSSVLSRQRLIIDEIALIDDLLLRYAVYSTTWNYSKYFFLFLNEFMASFKDLNEIENHECELNKRFLMNVKSFFPRLNEEEVVIEKKIGLTSPLKVLKQRQLEVARSVLVLYKLNENNYLEKIAKFEENFVKFFEKFLFKKN